MSDYNPGLKAGVIRTATNRALAPKTSTNVLCKNLAALCLGNEKSGSFADKRHEVHCN